MQTDPTDSPRGLGITYFIQAEDGGPVKIGRTTTEKGLRNRLSSLQIGNPSVLVVRRTLEGVGHEKELHRRFARLRLTGEWFQVDEELAGISHAIPSRVVDPERSVGYVVGYEQGFRDGVAEAHEKVLREVSDMTKALGEEIGDLAEDAGVFADDSLIARPRTAHAEFFDRAA